MSHSLVKIKHHLKLFVLISGVLILSSQWVLSFLVMSRGNKDHHFVFWTDCLTSLKAGIFISIVQDTAMPPCHSHQDLIAWRMSSWGGKHMKLSFRLQAQYDFITHLPLLETDPVSLSLWCTYPTQTHYQDISLVSSTFPPTE